MKLRYTTVNQTQAQADLIDATVALIRRARRFEKRKATINRRIAEQQRIVDLAWKNKQEKS